ncbi:hypothetical protein DOM22_01170 [Bdellovibrio sp. ZAP7]|uniref:hypothetical protein n=1 Tax=Bdellovibrio sp. ZAP7 TaxID=2231053 RepID=UPI00115BA807|nr:hypothetical protein [Bdellovibrio sp. ZAP7]QDK43869.1 hypothetical protein DOM22_01170 [Bdellovibrio sp. ZAP7]
MASKGKIDFKEMFESLKEYRFGSLDAGVALWLLWRRSQKRPVVARVAAEIIPGVTVPMIENYFSKKYGIGAIPVGEMSLKKICAFYDVELTEDEASDLILNCEKQYGASVDKGMGIKAKVKR